jgi:hypothetical protein
VAASTTRSFSDLPRIIRQRWYFTIAGLLVTLGLCTLAAMAVPVKYQAKAQILVLPPKTSVGTGGNQLLALGGLQGAADVLARAMSDGQTYQDLRATGLTGTYTVARDLTTSGPVLLVVADNSTPELALRTLQGILSEAAPRLTQLQDNLSVPESTRLTSNVFTEDLAASPQRKSQIRAVLVAFAAGIFATIMLVSTGDSLLRRRRQRALAGAGGTSPPPAAAAPPATEPAPTPGRRSPDVSHRSERNVSVKQSKRSARGPVPAGQPAKQPSDQLPDGLQPTSEQARPAVGTDKPRPQHGLPEAEAETADGASEWSAVTTERAGRRGRG